HFDALGRTCLAVADNGGGRYPSRTALDCEGKPLAVFDALGRRGFEKVLRATSPSGGLQIIAGPAIVGHAAFPNGAGGGARRSLVNVAGNPIWNWDARGHTFRIVYDAAQRPTRHYVSTNGAQEILIDLSIYGEGMPAANLCGRVFRHYDMAGYVENSQYDFK